jgi:putative ABC transport system substrate-binding protein
MKRRELLALLCAAAAWPAAAPAQPKLARIGVLLVGNLEPFWSEFREGLRAAGYVDGRNIQIELRSGKGNLQILPELAADLVRLKVDLIVASETPAVEAARQATKSIPIVMAPSGDPVRTGQIVSLAAPGGNVTGLSAATAELAGKSVELLREALPSLSRIAVLADPSNPFTKPFLEQIGQAAVALGVEVRPGLVRNEAEFDAAFATMATQRAQAVIVQPTLPRKTAVELALKHRLPSVSGNRAWPDAGGLMSYAASLADRYREAGGYVDRILKGRLPAELPVQQPSRFELVVNLRTAKALGVTVPASILRRADDVLE